MMPRLFAIKQGFIACSATRSFASPASTVTDQMINYALQQVKSQQHDQAVDVLQSGLSKQPEGKGLEAARLLMTQGTLEADRGRWAEALQCTSKVEEALASVGEAPGGELLRLAAGRLAVSVNLLQGQDEEGGTACQASAAAVTPEPKTKHTPLQAGVRLAGLSLSISTSHTLGRMDPLGKLGTALTTTVEQETGENVPHTWAHTAALVALGDWRAAGGGGDFGDGSGPAMKAAPLYKAATQGLAANAPLMSSEMYLLHRELGAAAALGTAQLAVQAGNWEEAEEALSKALAAAEDVSSDKHPRVVPALVLLGSVYSRTARVTFAEGLYREAAKILKVDPNVKPTQSTPARAHASLVAMLSWRFHQLLTVMPNRGSEAAAWKSLASAAWSTSGPVATAGIESVLGSSDQLSGKGSLGAGLLLSLPSRRALLPVPVEVIE